MKRNSETKRETERTEELWECKKWRKKELWNEDEVRHYYSFNDNGNSSVNMPSTEWCETQRQINWKKKGKTGNEAAVTDKVYVLCLVFVVCWDAFSIHSVYGIRMNMHTAHWWSGQWWVKTEALQRKLSRFQFFQHHCLHIINQTVT
jgi:hypothetical protein